jgi:hypothetical protein
MGYVANELLSRLAGRRLTSVVFVMDYVQLTFDDGPILTCDVWPVVVIDDQTRRINDAGYRDGLCSFITQVVVSTTEATGVGLIVRFERGSLSIHPEQEELVGPEIALLSGFDDRSWMVWRPGEESFEELA